MEFKNAVYKYCEEFAKEVKVAAESKEATKELSFRTSLDNFFKAVANSISDSIATIPEPRNQNKKGRPDWRFHNDKDMGVYGYVEAKGFDFVKRINVSDFISQVKRYLDLGNPVILTDGLEFICFYPNGNIESYDLISKPVDIENIKINLDAEVLFKKFFKESGHRRVNDKQIIEEVAHRAKNLSDEILDLLELEEDEAEDEQELKAIITLSCLKKNALSSPDNSLHDDKVLASYLSQIITFGLLYSHREIEKERLCPQKKYKRLKDYWLTESETLNSSTLTPFKHLIIALRSELSSTLSRLGLWYDDLCCLLSHIQLTKNQLSAPSFHELYEAFLTIYDPKVRFDYGAFYTPNDLAEYISKLTNQILSSAFELNPDELEFKKIIDPCCGTGTLLEAAIRNFNLSSASQLIGFEILPAPYALCQYRMQSLENSHSSKVKILLTNTLSNGLLIPTKANAKTFWSQEEREAYDLSCQPINLVIGNPPSSDSKFIEPNEGTEINSLLNDFRPPAAARGTRQNTQKQLTNEFVKFLRWCVHKALESETSAVSLILPSTFAEHPSYTYARKFLFEKFDQIWVLEFDSDERIKASGQNLFNTLQGRLLLIAVNGNDVIKKFKYKNISSLSKNQKIELISANTEMLNGWNDVQINKDTYSLKETVSADETPYADFWPLTGSKGKKGIYSRHCSGVKLAPTHLLVHADSGQLKRRSRFISKENYSYKDIIDTWYKGQAKPPPKSKITANVKNCISEALKGKNILDYSYRPFIETKVLFEKKLLQELKELGGEGTRFRPEILAVFSEPNNIVFSVSPAPKDNSEKLEKFSSFCRYLPDNDLTKRGNAHIFSNYYPMYKKQSRSEWDSSCSPNLNDDLVNLLKIKFETTHEYIYETLPYYIYAILSSDKYLGEYHDFLYSVAGLYPKIPIISDKSIFENFVKLGKKLSELECNTFSFAYNTVVDLKGLKYYSFKISVSSITLLDENKKSIMVISELNENVLGLKISGYPVVREWLKLHSYPYLRKELVQTMSEDFNSLIERLRLYLETIKDVDDLFSFIHHDMLIKFK